MHHAENNLLPDLSSTMPYRRDSAVDFLRYYFKFISLGIAELVAYFTRKKRFEAAGPAPQGRDAASGSPWWVSCS